MPNRERILLRELKGAILAAIKANLSWADVIVVSDYAKGLCNDRIIRMVVEMAAETGKASIIDPKRRDFAIYHDATLIKPNRRELTDATGVPCETDEEAEPPPLPRSPVRTQPFCSPARNAACRISSVTKGRCI
jgi:bifunctional ADP-heptose synthase (sugar kinase/adenylyltransferase)